MPLCFRKCHHKISKTPQNLIVLVCAAALRPQDTFRRSQIWVKPLELFIIGEVENTENRTTALWLQLYLKVTRKHVRKSISLLLFFTHILTKQLEEQTIAWLQLRIHFKQR